MGRELEEGSEIQGLHQQTQLKVSKVNNIHNLGLLTVLECHEKAQQRLLPFSYLPRTVLCAVLFYLLYQIAYVSWATRSLLLQSCAYLVMKSPALDVK